MPSTPRAPRRKTSLAWLLTTCMGVGAIVVAVLTVVAQ